MSFESTCLPLQQDLRSMATRFCRSRTDASDLVQETLLRAMLCWGDFEPERTGTNLHAWLHRIMLHVYKTNYCTSIRRRRLDDQFPDDLRRVHERASDALDAGFSDEVEGALLSLSPSHRQVVLLIDVRGGKYSDVAAELGVPIGTVMSRLHRARCELRSALAGVALAEHGLGRARQDSVRL